MQLNKKTLSVSGKETVVTLVKMGDTEGMFVQDVAKMLGTSPDNVRMHIKNHKLIVKNFYDAEIAEAKSAGLIPKNVVRINMVPRETIRQLVRIVGTPEALAAYNYLWEVAANPTVAAEHYLAIGKEKDIQSEIARLNAELGESGLRTDEVAQVNRAAEDALRRHGINPMAEWSYVNYGTGVARETGPKSAVYVDLRERFLPPNYPGAWRDMPRKHLQAALDLIAKWEPSAKDWVRFEKNRAILRTPEQVVEVKATKAREASAKSEAALAKRKAKAAKLTVV